MKTTNEILEEKFKKQLKIIDHPLIKHKIAILRDKNTDPKQFREVINELSMLMAYESFKDVDLTTKIVETPFEKIEQTVIKENSIAIIPVLRAGLGMVNGVLSLFPAAKVGHIGVYRDEKTLKPQQYYCKLPLNINKKISIIVDPMLATGNTASHAVELIKQQGCKKIKVMSIIAAQVGIETLLKDHPDIELYVAVVDRELNDKAYILPGLGDAGDRIFGTK